MQLGSDWQQLPWTGWGSRTGAQTGARAPKRSAEVSAEELDGGLLPHRRSPSYVPALVPGHATSGRVGSRQHTVNGMGGSNISGGLGGGAFGSRAGISLDLPSSPLSFAETDALPPPHAGGRRWGQHLQFSSDSTAATAIADSHLRSSGESVTSADRPAPWQRGMTADAIGALPAAIAASIAVSQRQSGCEPPSLDLYLTVDLLLGYPSLIRLCNCAS